MVPALVALVLVSYVWSLGLILLNYSHNLRLKHMRELLEASQSQVLYVMQRERAAYQEAYNEGILASLPQRTAEDYAKLALIRQALDVGERGSRHIRDALAPFLAKIKVAQHHERLYGDPDVTTLEFFDVEIPQGRFRYAVSPSVSDAMRAYSRAK